MRELDSRINLRLSKTGVPISSALTRGLVVITDPKPYNDSRLVDLIISLRAWSDAQLRRDESSPKP